MKTQSILLHLIYTFILLSLLACQQDDDDNGPGIALPDDIDTPVELTDALQEIYGTVEIPGFVVGTVKDGTVNYLQAFGLADVENNIPYTTTTLQPLGSVSKTFVGAAVLRAVDQGFFTLETDINDILPFELSNPKQPQHIIQVKHLLTHTSGLLDNNEAYLKQYYLLEPGTDPGTQIMRELLGLEVRDSRDLNTVIQDYYLPTGLYYNEDNFSNQPPGSAWSYSNFATSLAAFLVESAAGIPYDQYLREEVLTPIGMLRSGFDPTANGNELATLYWETATPLPSYGLDSYPDGSLWTSGDDMSFYLQDLLNGYQQNGQFAFPNSHYAQLFEPHLPAGMVPNNFAENQGINWFLTDGIASHTGADPGLVTRIQLYPENYAGFFILANIDASTEVHVADWVAAETQIATALLRYLF